VHAVDRSFADYKQMIDDGWRPGAAESEAYINRFLSRGDAHRLAKRIAAYNRRAPIARKEGI